MTERERALMRQAAANAMKKKSNQEWYNLRPILGNANWAMSYIILGGR